MGWCEQKGEGRGNVQFGQNKRIKAPEGGGNGIKHDTVMAKADARKTRKTRTQDEKEDTSTYTWGEKERR